MDVSDRSVIFVCIFLWEVSISSCTLAILIFSVNLCSFVLFFPLLGSFYFLIELFFFLFFFFKIYLLIMLLQLSHFPPFTPLHPAHLLPPTFPPYSSCPWVILKSSLASTFPTLFLPSPCLFSTYHQCYLFSVPLPPSPPPTPLLTTLMF